MRPLLSDVPWLFRFLGDPQAMRFTHCDASPRDCRRRIAVHEWFRRRDGCAPWAVMRRDDGRIIGWGGLYHDPFDRGWGVEVGYHFAPTAWGQGYATELVAACTGIADHGLRIPTLVAFAHPENRGSQRVLEKSGFRQERFVAAMNRFLYRRERGGSS
ncbi:MAG TPA: GNAT family N-acetyltransferase [Acetobacteraceae bacterium]|nr:GNAT family N-acetyltransferase [Acetobacteraceae bacterium]